MTSPVSPVSLLPPVPPGDFAVDLVHEPLWRQLGADHCRVAVIDLASLQPLAWRWMRDGGVSSGAGDAQPLDHILPGCDGLLGQWARHCEGEPGAVVTHTLSPRRWVYFWRIDDQLGALVQMHFLAPRHSKHEFDTAGVRVVCEHWLAPDLGALRGVTRAPSRIWDLVDRRARQPISRATRLAFFSLLGCGLLGLWFGSFGASLINDSAEAQQREIARLSALADNSLQLHLSQALAGGDYGQVQDVLSLHQSLGHFSAAGVTNDRGQLVAHAGFVPALPVGKPVAPEVRARAVAKPLAVGSSRLGEVLLVGGTHAPARQDIDRGSSWHALGWLLAALAAAGATLLWRDAFARRR